MFRTTVYIPEDLKKEAQEKLTKSFSEILIESLANELMKIDPDFKIKDKNDMVILAQCPFCHKFTQTSTVYIVRCCSCYHRFRVHTRYGFRGKIISGREKVEKAIKLMYRNNGGEKPIL